MIPQQKAIPKMTPHPTYTSRVFFSGRCREGRCFGCFLLVFCSLYDRYLTGGVSSPLVSLYLLSDPFSPILFFSSAFYAGLRYTPRATGTVFSGPFSQARVFFFFF
ncbi:hypothetical protein LX36DRAFT_283289 [Colletotrichum falcatum]|nr:hypothetical protein LX36DRAFT_283289 [Colletotrichum falcatum]